MSVPFGREFKKKHFTNQDPNYVNVNHGGMGVTPDVVIENYIDSFKTSQARFDDYLRYEQRDEYISALKSLALPDLLDCDYRSLAIVDSATAGVATVLRSFPFKSGDKILLTATTYSACASTVRYLKSRFGIVPVVLPIEYPLTQKEIVKKYEDVFSKEGPIKLAIVDTVTSVPGVRLPFEEIVELCRKNNTLSLVDAAHAVGLIELNLSKLKPDFLVSNLHKWFYVPKSTSVLYVDSSHHKTIQPLTISSAYAGVDNELPTSELESMRLIDAFWFTGTHNNAAVASIGLAKKFRQEECGGEEKIREYGKKLASETTKSIWKDYKLAPFGADAEAVTSMWNFEVPYTKWISKDIPFATVSKWLPHVIREISRKYKTFVQLFAHGGKVWVRFSFQTYNELADYEYAADAIEKGFKEFFADFSRYENAPETGNLFLVVEDFDKLNIK